jgi:hypothetical protein
LVLPGLLVVGLGLRLLHLDAALWYDEAFSAWLAELPLRSLVAATLGDVHPPGYYLLLWLVNRVLGHSEAALRLPSVGAGVGLVYAIFALGRALGVDKRAVWLATGITAFSPFQIYYSQEARCYALLSLAVAVAALGIINRRWWPAVVGSLAALYLHNMAVVFVGTVWLTAFLARPRPLKPFFVSGAVIMLGFLPGGFFLVHQLGSVGGGFWVPDLSSPGRLLAVLDDLLWYHPGQPFVIATACVTVLGLALVLGDLVTSLRGRQLPGVTNNTLALLVLLPLLAVTLASVVWQPVLISRVLAPIAPFYYLWLAVAVVRSRRRMVTWLVTAGPTAACILACFVTGAVGRTPVDPALNDLMSRADAIYHANVGSYVVWHYYAPETPQYVWPQETDLTGSLTTETRTAMGMKEITFEHIQCARLVNFETGRARDLRRWHLIYFHSPVSKPAEIAYINHLLADYPATRLKNLRSDDAVDAWVVSIEPKCTERILP